MDKKSKILFGFLALFIVLSVSASYYRYIVLHDYVIEAETDCDPTLESCFVWICDEAIDGECSGDAEEDTWYYKVIYRNAKNIPVCGDDEESCDEFICPDGEEECEIVTCTDEAREEYGIELACTISEDFVQEEFFEGELEDEEGVLIAEDDSISTEASDREGEQVLDEENTEEIKDENSDPVLQ